MSTSEHWSERDTDRLRGAITEIVDGADLLLEDHRRLRGEVESLQARVAELEEGQEPQPDPETPKPTITLDTLGDFELRDAPRVVKATVENAPEGAMVEWLIDLEEVDRDQPHNASITLDPNSLEPGDHVLRAWLKRHGAEVPYTSFSVEFTVVRPAEPAIPTVIRTQRDLWGEDSIWTRPLTADAPIHPDSDAMVAELVRQGEAYGRNINASYWTTGLYVAGPDDPSFDIVSTNPKSHAWARDMSPMQMPADARIDPRRDAHLTVVSPHNGEIDETWHTDFDGETLRAEYGGTLMMRGDDGIVPRNGATASNLPAIGGTILREEWAGVSSQGGYLNHALAMAIPQQWPGHVWPAKRTDQKPSVPQGVLESAQISMGTHFRLPHFWRAPSGMSLEAITICFALRDHGAYVRDKAGDVVFYAELGDEPLMPWAKLQSVLAEIPWGELQVVDHGPRTRRAGL